MKIDLGQKSTQIQEQLMDGPAINWNLLWQCTRSLKPEILAKVKRACQIN